MAEDPGWGLKATAHCPAIVGHEMVCMACESRYATGHVTVSGGPHNGRVLLLVCPQCAHPSDEMAHIRAALVNMAMADVVNLDWGGPGSKLAQYWHRDHWDPLIHAHEAN